MVTIRCSTAPTPYTTDGSRATRASCVAARLALAAAIVLLDATTARAQAPGERRRDVPVSPTERESVVRNVIALVRRNYVDSSAAQRMASDLERRLRAGEYTRFDSAAGLVASLTAQLRAVQPDEHLRVDYFVVPRPMRTPVGTAGVEDLEARRRVASRRGYGIERVERLSGNVAVVTLRSFEPPSIGGAALAAAMQLASGANAVILDLRQNGGGHGNMVGELAAYFVPGGTAMTELYDRPTARTERTTVPTRPGGPSFPHVPLFVVTSRRTFSAAEGFAYTMRVRGRATVVGEPTRGGANPVQVFQLAPHFALFLPTGRVTDLVTRANWEGSGVAPDVPAEAASALTVAYRRALEVLLTTESNPDALDEIREALARISSTGSTSNDARRQ